MPLKWTKSSPVSRARSTNQSTAGAAGAFALSAGAEGPPQAAPKALTMMHTRSGRNAVGNQLILAPEARPGLALGSWLCLERKRRAGIPPGPPQFRLQDWRPKTED